MDRAYSGRVLEPEEAEVIIGSLREELLDIISEISELAMRMRHASPVRLVGLMNQQQVFIDQMQGALRRLPPDVEAVEPMEEAQSQDDPEM
jgi:hypothetical protein